jgi:hypothetical protein
MPHIVMDLNLPINGQYYTIIFKRLRVRARERTFEKRPVEGPVDPRSASVVFGPDRNTSDLRSDSIVVGHGRDGGRGRRKKEALSDERADERMKVI